MEQILFNLCGFYTGGFSNLGYDTCFSLSGFVRKHEY